MRSLCDLRRFAAVLGVAVLIASCRDTGGEGEYYRLDGKLFVFNYRVATATYLVNIAPVKPPADGEVAVARFEDPAGGAPIVVREKIWPRLVRTTIQSPPLRCVAKGRPYAVTIRIEDATGAVKQTIETTMTSSEDQDILPDRPLVVGPLYQPNPELAGHPDGQLPGADEAPCPPRAQG
ncbi:hypothetical protein RB623_24830 [Mesorhizobium sp. LHD-90]|uniref:hypothetical protein n=1 Tax=Mesorhizobium sp. LHD-90 TaxID=3071414 RepID=UPI0027DFFCB3|nr:hypothetical protein [Mesorhizobium sp. LHD-90]MDQ6437290.1 hypothetical protein [Mesorhizobium sp. LHD-90]